MSAEARALRERIRNAIYTQERALWLDPEDLEEIVDDVMPIFDDYEYLDDPEHA